MFSHSRLVTGRAFILCMICVMPWVSSCVGRAHIHQTLVALLFPQISTVAVPSFHPQAGIFLTIQSYIIYICIYQCTCSEAYGYSVDPLVEEIFTRYRKTHNQGVFDVYSAETRLARTVGIITGLPDNYGRGRYDTIYL